MVELQDLEFETNIANKSVPTDPKTCIFFLK